VLTRRGWSFVGATVGLLVGSRLLGVVELTVLATAATALLIGAAAIVTVRPPVIAAHRTLHPPRVHAGTPARVDLELRNGGTRPAPLLELRDEFDNGRRVVDFLAPALMPGESGRGAYRLPTARRGIYRVGPLSVSRADPFGLVRVSRPVAPADELTVYPRVDDIMPLPATLGRDPMAGTARASRSSAGEDFAMLRAYEVGDDLRRVHWKSTAKTGELMIRQHEMPWQTRVTVLLDSRVSVHAGESFERAVEATASVVTAMASRLVLLRFVTSGGFELGFDAGHERYETLMERLATIDASPPDRWQALAARLRKDPHGGALVAVTANATHAELAALGRLRVRFSVVVAVVVRPSAYGGVDAAVAPSVPGVVIVPVSASTPFPVSWNLAVSRWQPRVALRP
jgi:uncharacterized protein (DUF58 family)